MSPAAQRYTIAVSRGILERPSETGAWTLRYDDEAVPCAPGESVAEALLAAGHLATTRSLKFRRHRGAYCLRGDCGTCLARVDGEPNIRTCLTPVRDGQSVQSQNRLTPVGPDPSALADKVFSKGLDHHHLMVRPRALNQLMKGIARNLAGLGTLPDRIDEAGAAHQHLQPEVVVIGGGPAGNAVAQTVRNDGHRCVVFERRPETAGHKAAHPDDLWGAGVFGVYPDEARIAAADVRPYAPDRVYTADAPHVVFTTGARDGMPPLHNNDLPGVVSARGLAETLNRTGLRPVGPCVVVGPPGEADTLAAAFGARRVALADVHGLEGSDGVEAVHLSDGTKLAATLVAMAPAPSAASELARQSGAQVRWDGAGFALLRDEAGRIASRGSWTAWAAGDVAGYVGASEAAADGARIGAAICAALSSPSSQDAATETEQ